MRKAKKGLLSVLSFAVSAIAALGAVWTVGAKEVKTIDAAAETAAWDSWDGTIASGFASGSGTSTSPYVIETAEQLAYLAQSVNAGNSYSDKYISLESNIDLCNIEWTPIGNADYDDENPFWGYFEGNNFAISNMSITAPTRCSVGLFGFVEYGSLSNFSILNYTIEATLSTKDYYAVGGLTGWLASNASNIYTSGKIDIEISNTSSENHIRVGGLAGQIWDYNNDVRAANCYAVSDIQVKSSTTERVDVGGFIGFVNGGTIQSCYAYANVESDASNGHVGGFVGANGGVGTSYKDGEIYNSFAVANVSSSHNVGGFIGDNTGTNSNCYYNTNIVSGNVANSIGTSTAVSNFKSASWLTSTLGFDFTNTWTFDNSNGYEYPVLQGLNTEYLPNLGSDWDSWDGTTANGFAYGDGTQSSPYVIETAEQLAYFAQSVNAGNSYAGKYVSLVKNLDLCNIKWMMIGTGVEHENHNMSTIFKGTFEGNHKVISNLYVHEEDCISAGLFHAVSGATIRNLGIENADVYTYHRNIARAGILCGIASNSMISGCYVEGVVEAVDKPYENPPHCASAGALIGGIEVNACTIKNCYGKASVTGRTIGLWNAYVGGLVGHVDSSLTIKNAYFQGDVESYGYAGSYAGGLLGIIDYSSSASISNSFTIANVVANSEDTTHYNVNSVSGIWDGIEASISNVYHAVTLMGEGYTRTPTQGTATNVSNFQSQNWISSTLGWDFDSVWMMGDDGYPVLQGSNGGNVVHQHSFVEESRVEPTCATEGYIHYICSGCGMDGYETLQPTGEHLNTYTVDAVEPTCVMAGYTGDVYCMDCDSIVSAGEVLNPPGHDFYIDHHVDSTCYEQGYDCLVCVRCGLAEYYYYPILEHNYVVENREEPCFGQGISVYTCINCGYSYEEYYPIIEVHALYLQEIVQPTCTSAGYEWYGCSLCNYREYHELEMTDHIYSTSYYYEIPCEGLGVIGYDCINCSDCYEEHYSIPVEPHNMCCEERREPTCIADGYELWRCMYCGYEEEYYMLPTENHDYYIETWDDPCQGVRVVYYHCMICGDSYEEYEVIPVMHDLELVEVIAPTCGVEGYECYACVLCGAQENIIIPPVEHVYVEDVFEDYCTGIAVIRYTCMNCGDSYEEYYDTEIKHGTLHSDNEVVATCVTLGYSGDWYCDICGTLVEMGTEVGYAEHIMVDVPGREATCQQEGLTDGVRCEVCDTWLVPQEVIVGTHVPSEWQPSKYDDFQRVCEEQIICLVCQTQLDVRIPAPEHTGEVIMRGHDATCEADGLTDGIYCEDCNQWVIEQEVIPGGHIESDWTTVYDEFGNVAYEEIVCERCGWQLDKRIPYVDNESDSDVNYGDGYGNGGGLDIYDNSVNVGAINVGCGGVIGVAGILPITLLGGAWMLRRRKDDFEE